MWQFFHTLKIDSIPLYVIVCVMGVKPLKYCMHYFVQRERTLK